MYLVLTEKCNMACAHCCFSRRPGKGKHMELAVAKKSIDFANSYGSYLCIGGGEPTLHPNFHEVLMYAIATMDEQIWLATNGSIAKTAIALARLAQANVIGCALSLDKFHSPIEQRVIDEFYKGGRGTGKEVRHCDTPSRAGRWKYGPKKCACPETTIDIYGRVRQCGCPRSPIIGDIFHAPVIIKHPDRCYKNFSM